MRRDELAQRWLASGRGRLWEAAELIGELDHCQEWLPVIRAFTRVQWTSLLDVTAASMRRWSMNP